MYTITRHIESIVQRRAKNCKAILLTGPRQVGKSTLFKHLFSDVCQVTFDDDLLLVQATEDPGLFLLNNPCPLMIDEVQKCPSIFSRLKIVLDNTDTLSNFYRTGTQKLQLIENVSDSLAGRISIVELSGLSLREINTVDFNHHFVPTEEYISNREKQYKKYTGDIWETIHRGSYPELYVNPRREWIDYYQSYVSTYLLLKPKNHLLFVRFMTAVAARTGQIINYTRLSSELAVSEVTVKEWISILEQSGIIYLLKPYAASALKRAVKTPKVYFRDTGLCCYLTRWLTPDTLKNGAMAGAMFERFVINEIVKSYTNEGLDYDFAVSYYNGRDRKKKNERGKTVEGEINLIVQENGVLYPIEITMNTMPNADIEAEFDVLDGISGRREVWARSSASLTEKCFSVKTLLPCRLSIFD